MNVKTEKDISLKLQNHFFKANHLERIAPKLPVIDSMVDAVLQLPDFPDLSKTIIIGVQHMLATTLTLFIDGLHRLGMPYENMFFAGKCYSSSPIVENEMRKLGVRLLLPIKPKKPGKYNKACHDTMRKMWDWCMREIEHKDIERIIILDEGGRCLENIPEIISFKYKIAAIEQTQSGLNNHGLKNLVFPIIEVASCAAKKILEPPLIAAAILKKFKTILSNTELSGTPVCGVIGNGAIGHAVAKSLLACGFNVAIYDKEAQAFTKKDNANLFRMEDIATLVANSQYIFGCTGNDITDYIDAFNNANKDKVLISCSSEDKEYLSLLKIIRKKSVVTIDPLSDITYWNNAKKSITILRGGFPINFDNSLESVPSKDIQLTRGLLLGAVLQAALGARKLINNGQAINGKLRQTLNPYVQNYVVSKWQKAQPAGRYTDDQLSLFNNIEWIKNYSNSAYHEDKTLTKCFSIEQEPAKRLKAKL